MSPVVAWQSSPRETLNTRPKIRHKNTAVSETLSEPLAFVELRRHSNSESRTEKKVLAGKSNNSVQLLNSKLHKSQPQLLGAKHRRTSDPGKSAGVPRWAKEIQNCPNLTSEPWYPLNEEYWGTLKEKRKPPTRKDSKYALSKSRSYSSEHDPWTSNSNFVPPPADPWRSPDQSPEGRLNCVWYPRETWSRASLKNVWYPLETNPYNPPANPWRPVDKSDELQFSRRNFASASWKCDVPKPESSASMDGWYQRYSDGLHQALELPRTRETLNTSLSLGRYLVAGTCRIPRASVRQPRTSRRSISSSAVKHERVCPGGGGGRCGGSGLTKAYSSEGPHYGAQQQLINPLHHHHHNGTHLQHRRPQVLSQSALGGGGSRRGAAVDDSGGIRPGRRGNAPAGAQTYELSQDLADKRIEMLERSYGGDQARRAATTIQRAYRHYAMTKKFRAITATAKAPERRLSRRFQGEASTSPGGTRNGTVPVNGDAAVHYRDTEQFIRSEFDELNKNLSAIYGDGRSQPRPTRTGSLRDSGRPSADTSGSADAAVNHSSSLEDSDNAVFYHNQSIDSSVIANDNLVKVPSSSSNDGTNINEGGNGTNLTVSVTNSSISSQDSGLPSNTALDNSNASPKDLKYFSSEDSGFGSHEGRGSGGLGARRVNKGGKKLPPEVPRRSSSIKSSESGHSADSYMGSPLPPNSRYQWASPASPSCFTPPLYATPDRGCLGRERSRSVERAVMRRCPDNGSLSSVQSSGSDSSLSQSASDRATPLSVHDNPDSLGELHIPTSPVWKRKNQMSTSELVYEDKRLSNISENSEDSCQSHSSDRLTYSQTAPSHNTRYPPYHAAQLPKVPEVLRKRQYRVGLNLFNKKPERGITYLINRYFLENSPLAVAKFLLTRKGLSKQMIGEYLGNLQNSFNMAVLEMFSQEIDLSGMQVDVALRKYQTYFRLPGEAQKIERLMQVFAQRYCQCNPDIIANLRDPETVFVLAFAIIMLNTDLHTASMKQEKRMKVEDFVKNLRGVDDGYDIDREMLEGMYQRIKAQEFRTGHDHVTQVMKVQQTMVEKRPNLALPHRRLVCYCRLYEVPDSSKKERAGLHQREVFLFNDLLVVTKIFSKKKNSVTYSFRQSFPLAGLSVLNKETPHYQYLIEIKQRVDQKLLIAFNARNEHDRSKFCEDLKESISEMDEMENLRIEGELEKTKASLRASRPTSTAENRDSGVADMEVISTGSDKSTLNTDGATSSGTLSAGTLKRTTLSNSLIDMHEAGL